MLSRETELERLGAVSAETGCEVFIKRDDRSHPRYGGNKPRKLARILADARARGADCVVTAGTVGSHHALATAVHGRAMALEVHAVLAPQPRTAHAQTVIEATLAQGVVVHPCPSLALVPLYQWAVLRALRAQGRRPMSIPVGGSNTLGASGYWDAMLELRAQIERGAMDGRWPDAIVCAHGSGGTHAGLLAAQRSLALPTRVVGVMVAIPWAIPRLRTAHLARSVQLACATEPPRARVSWRDVELVTDQLGPGYGARTPDGDAATELFARDGVTLDPTYTAKTAAAVLALARQRQSSRLVFWHTLSSAPYEPLREGLDRAKLAMIEPLWR